MINEIKKFLGDNSVTEIDGILNKFDVYFNMLISENEKYNITAITERNDVYLKHFLDCLLGLPFIKGSVIDIGTGGGFPGLVLKIACPNNEFLLVDSLNKRVNFLSSVITTLNLKKVTALHSRAEDLSKTKKYDTAVSRAVAPLSTLCELSLPFVKVGGTMVAYKASEVEEEVNNSKSAVKILGGVIDRVVKVELPSTDIVRSFIIIKKIKETPPIYPRGKNKPRLETL